MHEAVQNYINRKRADERVAFEKKRDAALIEAGLVLKEYAPSSQTYPNDVFPDSEWDPEQQQYRYFRQTAIPVTDEEYEELLSYLPAPTEENTGTSGAYHHIGSKIKTLAVATFIIELIVSIIGGIIMIASEEEELVIAGLISMCVGSLLGWISSWLLYGYGEVIDKVSSIDQKLCAAQKIPAPVSDFPAENDTDSNNAFSSDISGEKPISIYCPHCGKQLFFPANTHQAFCHACNRSFDIQ